MHKVLKDAIFMVEHGFNVNFIEWKVYDEGKEVGTNKKIKLDKSFTVNELKKLDIKGREYTVYGGGLF